MKLKVNYLDASDDDCRRWDYIVTVDGNDYCLAPSTLRNNWSDMEALKRARELFGQDTELEF